MNRRNFFKITGVTTVLSMVGLTDILSQSPEIITQDLSALCKMNANLIILQIRKDIETLGSSFIGELNTESTRKRFNRSAVFLLDRYIQTNTICEYCLLNNDITNTPFIIDKGMMCGTLYIKLNKVTSHCRIDFTIK